ncbi:hypothetical protein [Gluconacetobacter takamatsuzukensis]|uniref:Uncharacterized protein n=1 Tax=Gluconacetobacter takamatsuzukensis TaxID=1286190 RepID=A0A7W4KGJ8_9PROT|nr:hypothetical protein [Gluconacetobacter takamatsuzukensis]MBB2206562.1 hypothetical protein [Gluconacetobacter takamatsuzukensis]
MIAIYLDDRTDPTAPRENGWYLMDGTTILLAGPFSSREQAVLSIDEQEPDPDAGGPSPF